ncbi:PucR family transcriptional regulator [Streptomyces ochraceiscleroticus]|uniref:PucR family transcriptional regulator n=1 Tax=Streptomyces ochraceiscleroticus TaxID=47761 RepID=A0ABW1MT45_9ACTN|nr:PucR family transcriptional regulator [Streptomyces ochraceiscleroticus]
MSLTLQALVNKRELGLSVRTGAEHLHRGVKWALVSEHPDPSVFLEGGEFVLTTGSRLSPDASEHRRYVSRLVEAGAVALGFGLSGQYPAVPDDLAEAAHQASLPLLSVSEDAAFADISRYVGNCLVDEQQRALTFAVAAQRDLARAALSPSVARAIVSRLAKALRCWVLVLDQEGDLRAGTAVGRMHLPRVRIDLARLRDGDTGRSLSMTVGGDSVILMPLAVGGRVRGFLAVGRSLSFTASDQAIIITAVSLLCADLQGRGGALHLARQHRLAVVKIAIEGEPALAESISTVLETGWPEGRLRVALLGVPVRHELELLECAENDHALLSLGALVAVWDKGRVVVLLPQAEGDIRTLESLLRQVPYARGAVSEPAPGGELPDAWRKVHSVFNAAPDANRKLVVAGDVATMGLMRHLMNPEARAWAETLLQPLTDSGNGKSKIDLRHTLWTFLAHNGQVDASASALGIHRHTLRYRMTKVAEALECDIDDPATRSELWFALQLDDQV